MVDCGNILAAERTFSPVDESGLLNISSAISVSSALLVHLARADEGRCDERWHLQRRGARYRADRVGRVPPAAGRLAASGVAVVSLRTRTVKAAAMVSVSRTAKRPKVARGIVRVAESPAPNQRAKRASFVMPAPILTAVVPKSLAPP
eukprot:scaffold227661_cov31-Tisochrysis_lutea.AAC.1